MQRNMDGEKFTGVIGMIDILGFGKMISTQEIKFVRDKVVKVLFQSAEFANDLTNHGRHKYNKYSNIQVNVFPIKWLLFSDTVLVYLQVDDNSDSYINRKESAIASITYFCSMLMIKAYEANIALRGAISYGEVLISRDPIYYIGKPIYDAHKVEAMQQWSGIAILDSVIDGIDAEQIRAVKFKVPLKDGEKECTKEMYVVNWTIDNWLNHDFEKIFNPNNLTDLTPDVIKKKNNTITFYNALKK
jgi:hypothetical protein